MRPADSLWNRNFLLLYQGGVVSALGDQAYLVAILLWAKNTTESGTVAGALLFAGGVTGLLMPLGGVLADRYSRARLLALLDGVSGVCVLSLAALFYFFPAQHPYLLPAALSVAIIRGLCMTFFYPVEAALVPDLVSDAALTRANSLVESSFRLTALIGQGFGGLLFRLLGAPLLLAADGVSFLLSGLSELLIQEPPRKHPPARKGTGYFHELREGLRFTGQIRGFRIYLVEAAFANFCLAALTVGLPFYVEDVLHAPDDWYGYLLSSMGCGAIVGGLLAGQFQKAGALRGTVQITAMFVLNSCMLPLSLVDSRWAAMALLSTSWVFVGFHQVVITTLVQRRTPPQVRGRVFGLLAMIRNGLAPLGLATFGVLLDALGGRVGVVFFWAGTAGLVLIATATLLPGFRQFFTDEDCVAALPGEMKSSGG
jgi:MFS family permease